MITDIKIKLMLQNCFRIICESYETRGNVIILTLENVAQILMNLYYQMYEPVVLESSVAAATKEMKVTTYSLIGTASN